MKIDFYTHYFPPEGNAPATRVGGLSKRWAAEGQEVRVITGVPNVPEGKAYPGYRNRLRTQKEMWNGVQIFRVWTYLAANQGTVKRILNYLSYWVTADGQCLGMSRPQVVIATSPQFFCGWAGVLAKWIYRIRDPLGRRPVKLVIEIRDIWPESIGAVKAMKGSLAIRFLQWMEHRMYRSADHIVTVGEGYKRLLIERGVPAKKISVVMNGVDWELLNPPATSSQNVRERLGGMGKFVCAYVGTVGMACGLEIVLRAAEQLQQQGNTEIQFWIVGDGAKRAELEAEARQRSLQNVSFTGRVPKEMVAEVLSECDVCLVHLRATPLFETVIPSKIFETWGMKRPIIMGVKGEASLLIEKSQSGICIEPDHDQQLLAALEELKSDPERRKAMGENGFAYVRKHFDRDQLAADYLRILEEVVEESSV